MPPTATRDLTRDPIGKALKPGYGAAFEYSDCWVDDARLVVLNAQDAAERGATIRTRTRVTAAKRDGAHWAVEITDQTSGATERVLARMVVNAAGPWVETAMGETPAAGDAHAVRLVKGSHVVVRRQYEDPRCFFFQNADGRIFFAIPYEHDFTLIGTTDQDFEGDPAGIGISEDEVDYLIAAANDYFADPIGRDDVVWSYAGVRPLYNDGASKAQEATRDYVLKMSGEAGEGKLLTVIGGKITTYRRLAESALEKIENALGARGGAWTAGATLPGGDFGMEAFDAEVGQISAQYPFVAAEDVVRMVRRYGTRTRAILGDATREQDLGRHFGAGLYAAEVDYLIASEWARTSEDILWRRTKRGLYGDAIDRAVLDAYIEGRTS